MSKCRNFFNALGYDATETTRQSHSNRIQMDQSQAIHQLSELWHRRNVPQRHERSKYSSIRELLNHRNALYCAYIATEGREDIVGISSGRAGGFSDIKCTSKQVKPTHLLKSLHNTVPDSRCTPAWLHQCLANQRRAPAPPSTSAAAASCASALPKGGTPPRARTVFRQSRTAPSRPDVHITYTYKHDIR